MCGIFCSTDLSTFEVLEHVNRKRGNFSTGIFCCYGKANYNILRIEGGANWYETKLPGETGWLYLGHNQAPTETGRKWSEYTSHPFQYGDWFVAHNGVISNFHELIDEYIPMHEDKVDSTIIPAMLYKNDLDYSDGDNIDDEIENIISVLSVLEGTYAIWIVNIRTMNIYIARQGSTLFYKGNNISSIKGKGYKKVDEGVLYSYSYEGLTKLREFENKSPFLTL